eukprot:scaffold116596_cov73-Attheya_sp.AAC.1
MEVINACRLYLQVSRVSDISTADGRKVMIQMLTGAYTQEQIRMFRTTHIEWPYQERPNAKAWKLWTKTLLTTTCTETGHLIHPMGLWNEHIDKGWKYYLSPKDNYLYSRYDEGWRRHNPIRIGLIMKFTKDDFPTKAPETPYPVIPTINRNNIVCHHSLSSRRSPNQENTTAGSFSEYIESHTKPWEQHLFDHLVEKTESEISLSEHVKLGSDLFIVTDGGDTDGSRYFGWVIASDTHTLYEGSGLSPGNQEQNESLRSESTGFLAVLRFLLHYQTYCNVQFENCQKIHYCDNSILVSRSPSIYRSAPTSSFEYLKVDYDVQMQIIQTIHAIGIELPTLHVHGHQDKNTEPKNFTYEVKLNIEADLLATNAWQHHYKHQEYVHYPASQCTLYINKLAVNRSYRTYLCRAYASHDTRDYLMDKFKWDQAQCERIDWYSHATAIKNLPHNQL